MGRCDPDRDGLSDTPAVLARGADAGVNTLDGDLSGAVVLSDTSGAVVLSDTSGAVSGTSAGAVVVPDPLTIAVELWARRKLDPLTLIRRRRETSNDEHHDGLRLLLDGVPGPGCAHDEYGYTEHALGHGGLLGRRPFALTAMIDRAGNRAQGKARDEYVARYGEDPWNGRR